jgi:transcription initiation factor TFIIIB Brf1 subunit/transcription initiation factor TFIIB
MGIPAEDEVKCPICSGQDFGIRKSGMTYCRDCGNKLGPLRDDALEYKPFKDV